MFYAPHWIWKQLEHDRLKNIMSGLDGMSIEETSRREKIDKLCKYIVNSKGNHNIWVLNFIVCEFLCFINVVGNIWFTDYFLGHEFSTLGSKVLSYSDYDPEERSDPMSEIFPRVTKCVWHQ